MQKELFNAAPVAALSNSFSQEKPSFLDRYRLSLRLDQTLALMIGLLVAYVFVFSFGVETGKRYSMAELRAERSKRERMTEELSRKIFAQENAQTAAGLAQGTAAGMAVSAAVKTTGPAVPTGEKALMTAPAGEGTAAKAPAAPPTNAQEASKPSGRYTIQAVTVASKATAARELKKFTDKGHKAFVIPGGKRLQICVDGFESRDEAGRAMKQLKGQRLIPADAYVRSIA